MSSSNSPCAACKIQRRKCTQECVFAPYFLPEKPEKFASVHKVFGAKNVAKLLSEINATQREDAVNSLFYEAEQRLSDPVYGVVGSICFLQSRVKDLTDEIERARKELSFYLGTQAFHPMVQPSTHPHLFPPQYSVLGSGQHAQHVQPQIVHHQNPHPPHINFSGGSHGQGKLGNYVLMAPAGHGMGANTQALTMRDPRPQQHQQLQMYDAQHMAATVSAREFQQHEEMLRNLEQQDLIRFSGGVYNEASSPPTHSGFYSQISDPRISGGDETSATLAQANYDGVYHMQPQVQQDEQGHTVNIDHMDPHLFLQPNLPHQDRIPLRNISEPGKGKGVELPP